MKTTITVLVLMLVTTASWGAEQRQIQPGPAAFFWKIEGQGVNGHLLASISFVDKKDYPLPAAVEKAFQDSSTLILPMSVSPGEEKRMAALMLQKGLYVGEESLPGELSREAFSELERMLKEFGQDANSYAKVKPWFVGVSMTVAEFNRLGYNPEEGLLPYLQGKLKNKKKETGLLQYEKWISLLDGFSREENELYLRMSMQYCRFVREKHGLMRDFWRRGDLKALEKEFQEQWQKFPQLQKFQRWLDAETNRLAYGRLHQAMRMNPGFFMVYDIEKVCGENGLLHWLEKNGYRLTRIR